MTLAKTRHEKSFKKFFFASETSFLVYWLS